MRFYFTVVLLFVSQISLAAKEADQTHVLMTPQEQEIHMRAKKKLYPGGRDEDPLKVQTQLPQITRKMGPATEAPVEDTTEEPTDE